MSIKLSDTDKMPCKSWSLQALDTCPGSRTPTGSLVDACAGCYATTGFYQMKTVKAPREHNREDWKRDDWAADMIVAISKGKYFRWFDSGDMYSIQLAQKILVVMKATPKTNHWLPTRMHKFLKFADVIAEMNALPNVVVRFSSDSIVGEQVSGDYTSTIVAYANHASEGQTACRAYSRDGKCGQCRKCWSKDIPVIAYPIHGNKMKKVYSNIIASTSIAA